MVITFDGLGAQTILTADLAGVTRVGGIIAGCATVAFVTYAIPNAISGRFAAKVVVAGIVDTLLTVARAVCIGAAL